MKQKNKIESFFNFLPKLATYTFCIMMAIILVLIIIVVPFHKHHLLTSFSNYNFLYAILGLLLGFILAFIINKLNKSISRYKLFLIIGTIILFCLQMFVVYNKLFVAGWDVHRLYYPEFENDHYFSVYVNNLFIKGIINTTQNIFILPIYNALNLNITIESLTYFTFVIVSCICVLLSVLFATLVIKKLTSKNVSVVFFIFLSIFAGLMPWILVPYTDTPAMFFATLMIYAYTCIKNKNLKIILILFAAIIGFNIKPSIIFAFAGILFIEICLLVTKKKKIGAPTQLIPIILTCLICFGFVGIIKDNTGLIINKDDEHTATHYLMMGLDPDNEGLCNDYDRFISETAPNKEAREQANKAQITEYLNRMGLPGTMDLFMTKTQVNYADGTFMWEKDAGPNFYREKIGPNQNLYDSWPYVAQVLWFTTLFGSLLIIFNKKNKPTTCAICGTIILQTIFLMFFECGSRYLIVFIPYFVILSAVGWSNLSGIITRLKHV